jgi:hypothetical protein
MFNLDVSTPGVAVNSASGRPTAFRAGGQRLAVTTLESVRDETAAYPAESGPRTVFIVGAAGRRYRLVHLLRDRRWIVEEIGAGLARAA